jgi:hypothetical protein
MTPEASNERPHPCRGEPNDHLFPVLSAPHRSIRDLHSTADHRSCAVPDFAVTIATSASLLLVRTRPASGLVDVRGCWWDANTPPARQFDSPTPRRSVDWVGLPPEWQEAS